MNSELDRLLKEAKKMTEEKWAPVEEITPEPKLDPVMQKLLEDAPKEYEKPVKNFKDLEDKIKEHIRYYRSHEQSTIEYPEHRESTAHAMGAVGALEEILDYIRPQRQFKVEPDRRGEIKFQDRFDNEVVIKTNYSGGSVEHNIKINEVVLSQSMVRQLIPYLDHFQKHAVILPSIAIAIPEDILKDLWFQFHDADKIEEWLETPNEDFGGMPPQKVSHARLRAWIEEEWKY